MSNNSSGSSSGGIGFFGLLTVLFVGLKLTNHIDWSWWWVLSPIWLPVALLFGIVFAGALMVGISYAVQRFFR